tara:strand:- start:997 stop:1536 length:540 start_codon:yes stop_codon:yes gene_type:complete
MSGYVPKRVSSTRTAMGTTDQTPKGYGSVMLGMLSSVGRSSSNWRAIKRRSYVTSNQQINKNRYNLHTVSKVNVSNGKYIFNNGDSYDANLKYNLSLGVYKLTNIPQAHPIAILNDNITYIGDDDKKETKEVTGISRDFYYGDITVTITQNFDVASVYCYHHDYMGGEDIFKYTNLDNL